MSFREHVTRPAARGFSLVELMVAVVIGLLGILAIMSVFLVSEGQKRTTTGGAGAQENALIALVTMERDLRMAGLGLLGGLAPVGLGCNLVNGSAAGLGNFSFAPIPVTITRDPVGPLGVASDSLTIVHSTSPFANIPTTLTGPMALPTDTLNAANGDGFVAGDLILISEAGKDCALIQASANAVLAGTTWTIPNNTTGTAPFNPGVFPAGGFATGAKVVNMGPAPCCQVPAAANPMVRRVYSVLGTQGTSLMALNQNIAVAAGTNPAAIVEGIVAMRAQYGLDTNGDGFIDAYGSAAPASAAGLVAVLIAVVARSGELEKEDISPATLTLWNGGTLANGGAIDLTAIPSGRRYRYKVYQTTVPLRNVIWSN